MHNPPSVVISGCGLYSIRSSNASESVLSEYKVNLTRLVQPAESLQNKTRILWMVQAPVVEEKLNNDLPMITNTHINEYNNAALEVLRIHLFVFIYIV